MFRTQYPDIPRVDSHTHLVGRYQSEDVWPAIEAMRAKTLAECGADVATFIELDGGKLKSWNHQPAEGIERVKRGGGRVIPTLADYRPAQGLKASTPGDVKRWLDAGYCGWKMHWNAEFNGGPRAKYGLISDPYFTPFFAALEAAGMPLMCLHLDAPWGDGKKQRAALRAVMDRHPDLVVIQAHFGAQRWGTLAEHAAVFDAHPNFHRDISTTGQNLALWADHDEAREFFIRYADRLLWGTDNMSPFKAGSKVPVDRLVTKMIRQFEWLETAGPVSTDGIGAGTARTPETGPGMNLSRESLQKIYWLNAVRLVPHVREAMAALGHREPVGAPEKPAPEATQRAQRLGVLLPRVTERDILSLSAAGRAAVRTEVQRIARLTQ